MYNSLSTIHTDSSAVLSVLQAVRFAKLLHEKSIEQNRSVATSTIALLLSQYAR